MFNVLVFPGGTEVGLEIWNALAFCKEVRLFSAGMATPNHAPFVFKRHFVVPSVWEPGWRDRLNEVLRKNAIDYIFPAHDDVVLALARNAESVAARIVSSPAKTCEITRFKSKTYDRLRHVVPVPRAYESPEDSEFPVFVKPDRGQGAQDSFVVWDRFHLDLCLGSVDAPLIQEYLPGDEYTIDCFSDREAGLLFCGGRQRVRIRNGISMQGKTVHEDEFERYARAISSEIELHGAWFFQLRRDREGLLKVLEVAPRIAGTMCVHRVQGVNFPLLAIFEQQRVPLRTLVHRVKVEADRALTTRYRSDTVFNAVYVDMDDTLIVRGQVNVRLVQFVFQCINRGIPVRLITKHQGDVDCVLEGHRLHGVFDEVIQIDSTDRKSRHICPERAILIDDSFSERLDTAEVLGIPTFDCSMIDVLLDERV